MGRGRGKGKKQASVASHEGTGSSEEEKILPNRKRGRPQKPVKADTEEEKAKKIEEEENGENKTRDVADKDVKDQAAAENGGKRKRFSQVKRDAVSVKEENGAGKKTSTDDSVKSVGFRQNGSRRKNKPRRAAKVGVECQ